jgi:hypothetical protein
MRVCVAVWLSSRVPVHPRAPSSVPSVTVRHWHSQAAGCVAFTPDGAYALSGGAESVLVMWQASTGVPSYLPRLGADIVGVGVSATFTGSNPLMFAVALASNTLVGIDAASMKEVWRCRGLAMGTCEWVRCRRGRRKHGFLPPVLLPSSAPCCCW